jgi:putative protease
MIDLTNIGAGDKASPDKKALIAHFEQLLKKNTSQHNVEIYSSAQNTLNTMVPASTNSQYHNGL